MKQSTLPFKAIKKESKKKEKDSDDSDDIDFGSISPPPPRTSRRAAGIDHLCLDQIISIINTYYSLPSILPALTVKFTFAVKKNYTMSSEDSDDDSLEMFSLSESEQGYV